MCPCGFLSKNPTATWEFLEDLAEKTMQWETPHDDSMSSRFTNGRLHSVSDVNHLESKIAVLENMLKGLTPQMSQLSQTSTMSCSQCQALDHSLTACPYFAHQLATEQGKQVWPFRNLRMSPSPHITTQGGGITLTFSGIVDQMLWFLILNLGCFLKTTPTPSFIPQTPFRDWIF